MNAHIQAACHPEHEPLAAPSATGAQLLATQQQLDEPSSNANLSAVLVQPPASSSELQQPLAPRLAVDGGLQPALDTVEADPYNTGRTTPADAVASSLLPALTTAAQDSSADFLLSSGKRLHNAISLENNNTAQHKEQTEGSDEALPKKPKIGQ